MIQTSIPLKINQIQENKILNLVKSNSNDISLYVYEKNSPVYNFMSIREIFKMKEYLKRLNNGQRSSTSLIIAEVNEELVGYILYHSSISNSRDLSVISTIVDAEYRGQGIFKIMMDKLKELGDSITLTCFLSLVPLYKKIGFEVGGRWESHIGMFYKEVDDSAQVITVDEEIIYNLPEVKEAKQKFQSNNHNYRDLLNQLNESTAEEAKKANNFFLNNSQK